MLYAKEYITKDTLIGIWKVEESREELLALLSHTEWIQDIHTIKTKSRILEILSTRVLLKELTGEEKELYYNKSGKPFLVDNSYHISISHTKNYVAVAINKEKQIGLDIEYISDKIKRVQSRVIAENEYIDKDNELNHLLLHWSAKEAMFKFIDVEGVDFIKDLFVDRFTPSEKGTFKAAESRTEKRNNFNTYYKVEEDFVLVCLEADK